MLNFIEMTWLLKWLLDHDILNYDPDDRNRMLMYRSAPPDGNLYKEGWYSEPILDIASELCNDEDNLFSLLNVLSDNIESDTISLIDSYVEKHSTKFSEESPTSISGGRNRYFIVNHIVFL